MNAAGVVIVILVLIGMMHLYWATGGPVGKAGAIPSADGKPIISPGPIGTVAVGGALFAMATVVAATAGWLTTPLPASALRIASVLLAFMFAARAIGDFRYVGFFKRVRDSVFAHRDSYVYSPLCLLIAALIGIVVIS